MDNHEGINNSELTGSEPETANPDSAQGGDYAGSSILARLRLVELHRQNSLAELNSTRAILGTISADLAVAEAHLAEALRERLAGCPANIDEVAKYSDSIDLILRLAKQLAQLTQVDHKIAKREEQAAECADPKRRRNSR